MTEYMIYIYIKIIIMVHIHTVAWEWQDHFYFFGVLYIHTTVRINIYILLSIFPEVYNVPVNRLVKPSENLLIRSIDESFAAILETEIKSKPLTFMDPLICLVIGDTLADGFDRKDIDKYSYATLGGNHRRTVLQKLVGEGYFPDNTTVPSRLCFGKFDYVFLYFH